MSQIGAGEITVKGPLGTLTQALTPAAGIVREGDAAAGQARRRIDRGERHAAARCARCVANMVHGRDQGLRDDA